MKYKKSSLVADYSKNALNVCIVITFFCFALFTARLVDWQLVQGDKYKLLALQSTSTSYEIPAVRGEILDNDGNGLVVNTKFYKLVFDKSDLNENQLDDIILELINLLEKSDISWIDKLPVGYENNRFFYKDNMENEVEYLFSENMLNINQKVTAEDCFEKLSDRYGISNSHSNEEAYKLVSVHFNMEKCGFSNTVPYIMANGISEKSVEEITQYIDNKSGIGLEQYYVRNAVEPELAPHILGALGSISQEEYNQLSADDGRYSLTDKVGKFGIELACEKYLKGTNGQKIIQKDYEDNQINSVETINAVAGDTVYLTIDSDIQRITAESLEKNIRLAKKEGKAFNSEKSGADCETGAAVMLSVKDFSVLAAVSYPTYDLNSYSKYDDYYIKLSQDDNSPMYNRAFVGSFACGSVFKPCVALASLEEGIIDKDTEIYCSQYYDYYPQNIVSCMHFHENINVTGAIASSCNYFFADVGRKLGIETMYLYAERFGLGCYTGVEIEESKGFLAGRDSIKWQPGNTVQAAIGQSDNAFTPVQLAVYVGTVANNGTRFRTHIISKITDYEHKEIIKNSPEPIVECSGGISDENFATVQEAMLKVTSDPSGTAYSVFGDYPVKVGAKTGTAENSGSDNVTFICYAPFEKPEVAVSVVIENGASTRYAMNVAKDMLDAYFKFSNEDK